MIPVEDHIGLVQKVKIILKSIPPHLSHFRTKIKGRVHAY